jgi:WhiB family redox-sensing transcriptional regulator
MTSGDEDGFPSIESLLTRPAWMADAACSEMPLGLFFPSLGRTAAAARAVCSTCSVQPECLNYARGDSDTGGVWGGTTELERGHHGQVA